MEGMKRTRDLAQGGILQGRHSTEDTGRVESVSEERIKKASPNNIERCSSQALLVATGAPPLLFSVSVREAEAVGTPEPELGLRSGANIVNTESIGYFFPEVLTEESLPREAPCACQRSLLPSFCLTQHIPHRVLGC